MTPTKNESLPGLYRKKPVVIEAVQFTREMAEGSVELPAGVVMSSRSVNGDGRFPEHANDGQYLTNYSTCHRHYIETLEGRMDVQIGDWIIKGVKGEFYPCKPDIFAATYAAALSQTAGVPDVLFDGYAVYQGMTDEARARINAGGVSDVLDSVVRLIRAQGAPSASGGEDSVPCGDCDGRGHTDNQYPGSDFQPPEPELCSSCGGSGRWDANSSQPPAAASVSERACALFSAMLSAPYGDTTMGDIVCAETTRNRLESAWLPILEQALTQQRGALEPIAWAATDYQADGPITQYTSDRYAAEYYQSIGLDVRPLYATTPQPSADAVRELQDEVDRLNAIVNTPQSNDFLRAVSTEAEHQRQRWGSDHDAGKTSADWFWLVGYLAGKALHAHAAGDAAKAEHHIITTAAALANWHLAAFGKTDMRPGIDGESLLSGGSHA